MNKTLQSIVALTLGAIGLLILGAALYLVFVLPKTIAAWKEQERQLAVWEQLAMSVSALGQQYGLVILILPLLVVVACTVWAVAAIRGRKRIGPPIRLAGQRGSH